MKKGLILLLVFLTSFQLTGGYAVASAFASIASPVSGPEMGKQIVSQKHISFLHYLNQLLNQEEYEEEYSKLFGHTPTIIHYFYSFVPDFSVQNKHFLVHYAASIKGKLPSLFLLHNIFRL